MSADLGFFKAYFSSRQRANMSDLNALRQNEDATADQLASLGLEIGRLQDSVLELSATVAVLLNMIGAANHIDPSAVHDRVDAMLTELRASGVAPTAAQTLRCIRCHRRVEPARTLMTGNGPICDPPCTP
jgi:hypothetical protein